MVLDFDTLFMNMAYLVAMKSKDESTHVGAVIVGQDNEVRSMGYNSYPRGIEDDVQVRQERPEKYHWFSHAERNSIYNAARVGIPVKGCRMYTNGIPCNDCAFAIINSGISEVIVDKLWDDGNTGLWLEHAERTLVMFGEAGVSVRYWEGELVNIDRFMRGAILNGTTSTLNK